MENYFIDINTKRDMTKNHTDNVVHPMLKRYTDIDKAATDILNRNLNRSSRNLTVLVDSISFNAAI